MQKRGFLKIIHLKEPTKFEKELAKLIDKHNIESGSNMQPKIIAAFVVRVIQALDNVVLDNAIENGNVSEG